MLKIDKIERMISAGGNTLRGLVPERAWFCCCRGVTQESLHVPALRQGVVLEGVAEASHSGQARRATGGIPVCDLRTRLLLEEFANDAHLHVPQVAAGGHRH